MKCIICNKETEWFEPRFGYAACEEHQKLSPVKISELRNKPFPKTPPEGEYTNED